MVVYICVFVALDKILDFKLVSRAHEHFVPAAILNLTSSIELRDVIVDPRYLNVDTASSCDPPKSTLPTRFGALETSIIFVLAVFILIPARSALLLNCTYVSSMLGRCSQQRSPSSAYPSLSIVVLSSWIGSLVGGVFRIIHSSTKLNKSVDKAHPCFSPPWISKDSVSTPSILTLHVVF